MSNKHGHEKQHHNGHGKPAGRERQQRIGMVQQRSMLATVIAFGLILFVALGILTVIAYMVWG